MNNIKLLMRILAGILYTLGGIIVVLFIGLILIKNTRFDYREIIIISIIFIVFILLATISLIYTIENENRRFAIIKIFSTVIFGWYCFLLFYLLFYMRVQHRDMATYFNNYHLSSHIKWHTNFIPFKTIGNYVVSFINGSCSKRDIIVNIIGNIFAFSPMGFLLPSIFEKLKKPKNFYILIVILLVGVELVQLFSFSGSLDIDDVILNLVGVILFYGLWRLKPVQGFLRKSYVIRN